MSRELLLDAKFRAWVKIRMMSTVLAVLASVVAAPAVMGQEPVQGHQAASDIDVRYFHKKLELAQHDLQTALDANRRIPNLNSKLSLLRLENQVTYAKKLVEQAGKHDDIDLHESHLESLKNDLSLAEKQLAWAKKASEYVRDDEVKRQELVAQLARLALERAEQPEVTADPTQHLQWQIDRLRSELLALRVEFERTRSAR
ncbi:hypothetical protein [Stieleria mannarensis]|uniref:hypothetical protein n=1 Tax=Stieleria mannarensis TaxID=2755585 RepID=UPI0016035BB9|nr:hypothetical protein [Rhodopirellula sp. JC639]